MMPETERSPFMMKRAILQTVVYADIFDYPLTENEIHRYLTGFPAPLESVSNALRNGGLVPSLLERAGDYYHLPGRERVVSSRQRRGQVAARLWTQARRYGRVIAAL